MFALIQTTSYFIDKSLNSINSQISSYIGDGTKQSRARVLAVRIQNFFLDSNGCGVDERPSRGSEGSARIWGKRAPKNILHKKSDGSHGYEDVPRGMLEFFISSSKSGTEAFASEMGKDSSGVPKGVYGEPIKEMVGVDPGTNPVVLLVSKQMEDGFENFGIVKHILLKKHVFIC